MTTSPSLCSLWWIVPFRFISPRVVDCSWDKEYALLWKPSSSKCVDAAWLAATSHFAFWWRLNRNEYCILTWSSSPFLTLKTNLLVNFPSVPSLSPNFIMITTTQNSTKTTNTQNAMTMTTAMNKPLKLMIPSRLNGFKSQLFLLNHRLSMACIEPFSWCFNTAWLTSCNHGDPLRSASPSPKLKKLGPARLYEQFSSLLATWLSER